MEYKEDDTTVGEVLTKVKLWAKYLLSKWMLLLITSVICAGLGLGIAFFIRPTYTATLTFVLSSESKGGSLSGLASMVGIDLNGVSGNDVFSGDNILTLFKSQRMIKTVLFEKPPGVNDILANIIAKDWEWDKKWTKKNRTRNQFPFPSDTSKLTLIQDSLLREIHLKIVDKVLSVTRVDKKLTVYELTAISKNEEFSCYLTKYLMDKTARFYIETKTRLSRLNLQMLEKEADSLRYLLGGTIVSTAGEVDRTFNLNPALQKQRASIQQSQIRATVLGAAYGEVVKNLELAKIQLQKETPLYQIIDEPELPLKAKRLSKVLFLAVGGFLGLLLASAYLIFSASIKKSLTNS